jgi:hypothetical protein
MELTLNIRNLENVGTVSEGDVRMFTRIFEALISSGGLTGVKGGSTILHFDGEGKFRGVQLNYWPYRVQ